MALWLLAELFQHQVKSGPVGVVMQALTKPLLPTLSGKLFKYILCANGDHHGHSARK